MSATKTSKRNASRKPLQLKEACAVYIVSKNGKAKAKEVQLEIYICLPKAADVNQFTDKLIGLVEAYIGAVGGGTVMSLFHSPANEFAAT